MSTNLEGDQPERREAPTAAGPGDAGRQSHAHRWGFTKHPWFLTVLASYVVAFSLYGVLPILSLIPPVLTAAVLSPSVSSLIGRWARTLRRARGGSLLEPALVCGGLAGLSWIQFGYLFRQDVPIASYDHHMMIARAQLLAEGLARGEIWHWSHLFQGGDSLTDLYPVFLNFVTAAMHLCAPEGTPFVETYTVFCVFAWWLRGVAVYNLSRRFAAPFVSALITFASLYEVGGEVFDGIWSGALLWGMVHNNLALTLGLFAVSLQVDLTRSVSPQRIVGAAILTCLTAMAHPLGLLTMVVTIASFSAAAVLVGRNHYERAFWAAAAPSLGVLLASIWNLPYVHTLTNYGFNGSIVGVDYADVGRGFFDGSVPVSSFPTLFGAAIIAVLLAFASRRRPLVAAAIVTLAFFLLALVPFLVQSRVFTHVPSFLDAQQRRALTVMKTAVLPCVAYFGQLIWSKLRTRGGLDFRSVIMRGVLVALVAYGPGRAIASGVVRLAQNLTAQVPVPARGKDGRRVHDTSPEHQAAMAWLADQRKRDPSPVPWRVVLLDRYDRRSHPHWFWAQGVEIGVPVVDYGWVSANFIGIRPREFSEQGLREWNVRFAVGVGGKPPVPSAVERFRSGPYQVWELTNYDDRFILPPPGVNISDLSVRHSSIRFRVDSAPPVGVKLLVRSAWFPRWQARQEGRALSVWGELPRPEAKARQEQIAVQVNNGIVELTCDAPLPRFWLGSSASLTGVVLLGFFSTGNRFRRVLPWTAAALRRGRNRVALMRPLSSPRARSVGLGIAAACCALALLIACFRGTTYLLVPPIEGVGLSVKLKRGARTTHCWPLPHLGRYGCGESGDNAASVSGALGETPIADDAGEYGKKWPANKVWIAKAGDTLILDFARVDTRAGVLRVETLAYGSFAMGLDTEDPVTVPQSGRFVITLPDRRSSTTLRLRVQGHTANGTLLFRASTKAIGF